MIPRPGPSQEIMRHTEKANLVRTRVRRVYHAQTCLRWRLLQFCLLRSSISLSAIDPRNQPASIHSANPVIMIEVEPEQ